MCIIVTVCCFSPDSSLEPLSSTYKQNEGITSHRTTSLYFIIFLPFVIIELNHVYLHNKRSVNKFHQLYSLSVIKLIENTNHVHHELSKREQSAFLCEDPFGGYKGMLHFLDIRNRR